MEKIYDADQKRAIGVKDGYYLVLAPPGCGKTDILAERIAEAIKQGVEFEDMLCLTFTNRASRGMVNRAAGRVGNDIRKIFVGNVHRYCSRYIFDHSVVAENTCVFDEEDQADLFAAYDDSYFINRNGTYNRNAVGYVAGLASYITQTRLGHIEEVKPQGDRYREFYNIAAGCNFDSSLVVAEHKALVYALEYIKYKQHRNIIDFQDILIEAYDHLLNNDHKRYKWIQIDEVQDLNPLQLAIVDLLTDDNPTVLYLGDEQQAIFSFMGAKLSQLSKLKDRCAGNVLTLSNNYRAPSYLLDVCNRYAVEELKVDEGLLPKAITDSEAKKYDLILTESTTAREERNRILGMVRYYLNIDPEERLAILVSKNDEADVISKTLTDSGVPNFKISGRDMFKTISYKTLSSLYSIIADDFNIVSWSRLLYGIGAVKTLSEARSVTSKLRSLMMTPSDMLYGETYLQRFYKAYTSGEMVIFDTETTGLNVLDDDIVQIAAVKVKDGKKVEGSEFDIIMTTDREIPEKLGELDNPLVKRYRDARRMSREDGLLMFLDYIGDCPLLGHNVNYDYNILRNNIKRTLGREFICNTYDSLHIIKCVEPGLRKYKLEYLLSHLNLKGKNSHLANEDVEATLSLVDYCVEKMKPLLDNQTSYLHIPKTRGIVNKLLKIRPLLMDVKSRMHKPVSAGGRDLAMEMQAMHKRMVAEGFIEDLGPKFEIFIRYLQSEWGFDEEAAARTCLYGQISEHIYEMTSTINEGDLVNSPDLLDDRVFIMTVYKAKGLEFENVVVLGAVKGTYPFYYIDKVLSDPRSTSEMRRKARLDYMEDARKFYVAISRAKKRLCISYSTYNQHNFLAGVTPFIRSIKNCFDYFRR